MGHWLNKQNKKKKKKKKKTANAKTAALKLNRIGNLVVAQPLSFYHSFSQLSLFLWFFFFFFHYCIDARTTQYYLPLLVTTICLINLYLCTWFIAICVHVVRQVELVKVIWTFNPIHSKTREKDPVIPEFVCLWFTRKPARIRTCVLS